jgi:hypothetical protein
MRPYICPSPTFLLRCHEWIFFVLYPYFNLGWCTSCYIFEWPLGGHFSYLETIFWAPNSQTMHFACRALGLQYTICTLFSILTSSVIDFVTGSKMATWHTLSLFQKQKCSGENPSSQDQWCEPCVVSWSEWEGREDQLLVGEDGGNLK